MRSKTQARPGRWVTSPRARRFTLSPLNADELFEALGALPGARSVRASNGLGASRVLAGVEVVRAQVVDERALRKAWRERAKGGPAPLLVVVDDPDREGAVRALGPLGADEPVRVVEAGDLLRVLEELPSLSKLRAVRKLAEELDRLDRTGIAGLSVKGLGTEHLYGTRLLTQPRWNELRALEPAQRGSWRDVLESLGYDLERLKRRGHLARHGGRPVAVVWPLNDPAAFSRLDEEGRPPEGVLVNDCIRTGAPYGLLASGARMRLFRAQPQHGSAVSSFLELDAGALSAEHRPLLGLLSPEYLAQDGFEALMREAAAFGAQIRERLDRSIREHALPALGLELGRWAEREGRDVADDDVRAELEAAALTLVFRLLFLLYAESAGHLPVGQEAYRRASLTQVVQDAHESAASLGARSTTLWRRIGLLVDAMRTGDPAMSVPAYNGALFAPDGFLGAEVLERATVPDAVLGPALTALGIEEESGTGVDFSGLAIGHLGHIYEGLLSLRLSIADRDYRYDPGADRYMPAEAGEAEVRRGELLWLTDEGGRKGGGVYYTPEALVRHLVRRAVLGSFERHLEGVEELVRTDPSAAAEALFEFRVLDPACGSAHFLVAVVDELADRVARFLADRPLPAVEKLLDDLRAGAARSYGVGVDDVALLRRLVLKRCVYGVDLSEMGAEIAKISLWLGSFVPGLSLSYLDHNVGVGNSLIGAASLEQVKEGEDAGQVSLIAQLVRDEVGKGARAAAALVQMPDRTPDEVEESAEADRQAQGAVDSARRMLDLWAAGPLGLDGAREELWQRADELAAGAPSDLADKAREVARRERVLHWPLAFPEVFEREEGPGFDALVGNPPWEEVTVEELAFYARYRPGLRALPERARDAALAELRAERPELWGRLQDELARVAAMRAYFAADTGYRGGPGDPDLYKFFSQRYERLLREGGSLGVVLPRSAFAAKGSADFRDWIFTGARVERLDFLLNSGRWAFDAEPRYTVGLLVARAQPPAADGAIEVAGVASSARDFDAQSGAAGLELSRDALGSAWEVPLLPRQRDADVLAKLRRSGAFAHGGGRWRCFPVSELHETNDRKLWEGATEGWELWKGGSFNQYDPGGADARLCPPSEAALKKARKPRPGGGSVLAAELPVAERAAAVAHELGRARVAFRDITRATDSRTVIAALVPPETFLTNKAPYLAFVGGSDTDRAACLGVMNSLPFDWQARRFVEINLNFFVLEGFKVPNLDDDAYEAIARAAARLSCPDNRFEDVAEATGVGHGGLTEDERVRLRVEIDAHVASAWSFTPDELEVVFSDFTLDAVPEYYRERLRERFRELNAA